jgi:hypothetical protein
MTAAHCNNPDDPNPLLQTTLSYSNNAVELHSVDGGLLVTNKGWSAFPNANHYQGQLQNPQSVRVLSGKRGSTHFIVPCELRQ